MSGQDSKDYAERLAGHVGQRIQADLPPVVRGRIAAAPGRERVGGLVARRGKQEHEVPQGQQEQELGHVAAHAGRPYQTDPEQRKSPCGPIFDGS